MAELLGPMSAPGTVDERTRAQQLRDEGRTLREIGRVLLAEGYRPTRAIQWHIQAVAALLASGWLVIYLYRVLMALIFKA